MCKALRQLSVGSPVPLSIKQPQVQSFLKMYLCQGISDSSASQMNKNTSDPAFENFFAETSQQIT